MKRTVFVLFLLLAFSCSVFSQHRGARHNIKNKRNVHEITFGIGATNFLGELGGANRIGSPKVNIRDFDIQSVKPSLHLGYRYLFHKNWAVSGGLAAGYIYGDDQYTEEMFRHNRNLSFRSPVIELTGRIEYCINFVKKGQQHDLNIQGWRNIHITGFFFLGAGAFYMNPKTKVGGTWIALKPLCTEGQDFVPTRKEYSLFQFNIPFGVGLRFKVHKKWTIAIEYGIRWTTTDYVDDVSMTYVDVDALRAAHGDLAVQLANPCIDSHPGDPLYTSTLAGQQRGDPRDHDSYMFAFLSVYYNLKRGYIPKLRF
jgi:hypothetical protein